MRAYIKKAIMGGKINITLMFLLGFWGKVFRGIWGESGGRRVSKGTKKH